MKKSISLLVFVSLFSFLSAFSQIQESSPYSSDVFQSRDNGLNLLSDLTIISQVNQESSFLNQNVQNSVVINQIGFNNYINAQTQSDYSNIELYQNGNSNVIDVNVVAPSITENIIQNGNNNSVTDNIYYSNQNVKLQLIQKGDNLSLNRIGANSISNKLQLVQEGNFKTITVISN